jgi:hypothetical protein
MTTTWRGWRWKGGGWHAVGDGVSLESVAKLLSLVCAGTKDACLAITSGAAPTWRPSEGRPILEEPTVGT